MPVTMSVRQQSSAGQRTFSAGQCPVSGTYFRACCQYGMSSKPLMKIHCSKG